MTIKLEVFEGPLDLLLHLIRKHEVDVTDIPIVKITEQYMEYLNFMKELDLDLAGDYLVMAATLVHIKSRMLLPPEPRDDEDEAEDPRAELVRQLLEYEKFQRVADELGQRRLVEQASYPSGAPAEFEQQEELLMEASLFDLIAAFKNLLESSDEPTTLSIETYRLSVADRIQGLMEELERTDRLSFSELFLADASRHHWIVTFLALLELARLRVISLTQRGRFGDLGISRRQVVEEEGAEHGSDST